MPTHARAPVLHPISIRNEALQDLPPAIGSGARHLDREKLADVALTPLVLRVSMARGELGLEDSAVARQDGQIPMVLASSTEVHKLVPVMVSLGFTGSPADGVGAYWQHTAYA